MKSRIFLVLAIFTFLLPAAHAQPQPLQLYASDTIDCAVGYSTLRPDSLLNKGVVPWVWVDDSTGYNDVRFDKKQSSSPIQLEIRVRTTGGRADTLIVREYTRGAWIDGVGYDTVSVLVPIMKLETATVDTMLVVSGGPVSSFQGQTYRYASGLLYSSAFENHVWVIERRSGKGHPLIPDASATHKVIIEIYRRVAYMEGGTR